MDSGKPKKITDEQWRTGVLNSDAKIPLAISMKEKWDNWLQENISDPMSQRGYENLGPGIAAGLSAGAEMLIPSSSSEAMPLPPFGKIGKLLSKEERAAERALKNKEVLSKYGLKRDTGAALTNSAKKSSNKTADVTSIFDKNPEAKKAMDSADNLHDVDDDLISSISDAVHKNSMEATEFKTGIDVGDLWSKKQLLEMKADTVLSVKEDIKAIEKRINRKMSERDIKTYIANKYDQAEGNMPGNVVDWTVDIINSELKPGLKLARKEEARGFAEEFNKNKNVVPESEAVKSRTPGVTVLENGNVKLDRIPNSVTQPTEYAEYMKQFEQPNVSSGSDSNVLSLLENRLNKKEEARKLAEEFNKGKKK